MDITHFEKMDSYIPAGFELLSFKGFILSNLVISAFIVVRYFLMVAPFYFSFTKKHYAQDHIKKPKKNQVLFEIKYSILSTVFFSLSAYVMGVVWQLGWSKIYLNIDQYGYWYLPVSFIIYALIHEFYFYWTHVWMHQPKIFRKVHAIHHYSQQVTPWASFSFHPIECMVHAIFIPIMVLLVPIHPLVILTYLVFMTVTAISNHLGVELIPWGVIKKHFISGDHHRLHHEKFNGNYGLYFCFVDRLYDTEFKETENSLKNLKIVETKQ